MTTPDTRRNRTFTLAQRTIRSARATEWNRTNKERRAARMAAKKIVP